MEYINIILEEHGFTTCYLGSFWISLTNKLIKIGYSGVSYYESKEMIAIYAFPGGLLDRCCKLWVVSSTLLLFAVYSNFYWPCFLFWIAFSTWLFKRRKIVEFTNNGASFYQVSSFLPSKVQNLTLKVEEKNKSIGVPTRGFGGIRSPGTETVLKIVDPDGQTLWERSFLLTGSATDFGKLVERTANLTKSDSV